MYHNNSLLGSALAQFQQRLTADLIRITIEGPGFTGFGVTTKAIVKRNLLRWQRGMARRVR